MTRTLIDIDDDKLEAAKRALGTCTTVETVNRALVEVGQKKARLRPRRPRLDVGVTPLSYDDRTLGAGARLAALSPTARTIKGMCPWQPKKFEAGSARSWRWRSAWKKPRC